MSDQDVQVQLSAPLFLNPEDKASQGTSAPEDTTTSSTNQPANHDLKHETIQISQDAFNALTEHNQARKSQGLQPLLWSNALASHAQQWANHLAQIGQMVHSGNDTRTGEGENLAWAWGSNGVSNPMTGGIKSWLDEAKDYHGEKIGEGNGHQHGHYTQCMWNSTTHVGLACGKDAKGGWYTVRGYAPPGNWSGQRPY